MKKFLQKFKCCLPFFSRRRSSTSTPLTIVNKCHDHHGGAPISISTLRFPDGPTPVLPDVDTTAINTSHAAVVDDDAHISIPPVSGTTTIISSKCHGGDSPVSGLPDDDADTSTTHTSSCGTEDDLPDDDAATTSTTQTSSSYDEDEGGDADAPVNRYKSHDDDNDVDDAPISISPVHDPTPISTSHDDDDDACLSISATLPDDILCEIFHRLPLESLHRSKWVSRSWHSLITRQSLPKIHQHSRFIGFYHCGFVVPDLVKTGNNAAERFNRCTLTGAGDDPVCDPALSFLPSYYQPWVLASRNGLLLCLLKTRTRAPIICVCNPCTNSWARIPFHEYDLVRHPTFRLFIYMFLDFDPSISPHYKVIALYALDSHLSIYHSETGRMEEKRLSCGDRPIPWSWHDNCALWDGSLLVHGYDPEHLDEALMFRISEGDVLDPEYVKFPEGTEHPIKFVEGIRDPMISTGPCMGIMGGELCYATLDDDRMRVRVWTVAVAGGEQYHEKKYRWVLKHDGPPVRDDIARSSRVVGFHPLQHALFILCGNEIFAYHLQSTSFDKICQIRSEAEGISFHPYFSCSPPCVLKS